MSTNGKKKRGVIKYKSYLFVDKDPIIDAFRTAMSDADMSPREVEEAGGPKKGTIYGWIHKDVKRPQFATMSAALVSVGCKGIQYGKDGRPKIVR